MFYHPIWCVYVSVLLMKLLAMCLLKQNSRLQSLIEHSPRCLSLLFRSTTHDQWWLSIRFLQFHSAITYPRYIAWLRHSRPSSSCLEHASC